MSSVFESIKTALWASLQVFVYAVHVITENGNVSSGVAMQQPVHHPHSLVWKSVEISRSLSVAPTLAAFEIVYIILD